MAYERTALGQHQLARKLYITKQLNISSQFSPFSPFTAPACKFSGLKSAHIHVYKQCI